MVCERLVRGIGCLVTLVALGCGNVDPAEEEALGTQTSELASPDNTVFWPNGVVPICWEASFANHPNFVRYSNRIMEILYDNFTPFANLHFEDAGRCAANASGVLRVHHTPTGGAYSTGYGLNAAVVFNFNNEWWTGAASLTQQVVMHEFAHVLGFIHEFQRWDWILACDFAQENFYFFDPHTNIDPQSITVSTYCNANTVLSAQDIAGLQSIYGTPGARRIHAAATDSGQDLMYHWWSGSNWIWTELFADSDNLTTGVALAPHRASTLTHVHGYSLAGNSLVRHRFDGGSWSRAKYTNKSVDMQPRVNAYRLYSQANYAYSTPWWIATTRDTSGNLSALSTPAWGNPDSWQNLGKPAGGNVQDIGVITYRDYAESGTRFYGFVKAADGNVYVRYGTGLGFTTGSTSWSGSLGKPPGGIVGPFAVSTSRFCLAGSCAPDATRVIHLWTVSGGDLWVLLWNGQTWGWVNKGRPLGIPLIPVRPTTVQWTEYGALIHSVFVLDASGRLYQYRWDGATSGGFIAHDRPNNVGISSEPSATTFRIPQPPSTPTGVTAATQAIYVFVIGSDNKAYVRWTANGGTSWAWADQTTPYGNTPVMVSPGISAINYWSR